MDDFDSDVAVIDEPVVTTERPAPRNREETRTRKQPVYVVKVHNDNDHTFQYVFVVFKAVLGYADERCMQLVKMVDGEGMAVVWRGSLEVAELKREQMVTAGPDVFATKIVDYPLNVTVEPAEEDE